MKRDSGRVSVPDTTGTTYTCSATNFVGSASNSITIKKDSVKPNVVVKKPPANAVYALNQRVLASYSCLDATSGVATCAGSVANGAAINTSALGQQSLTVNGTDNAGDATTKRFSTHLIRPQRRRCSRSKQVPIPGHRWSRSRMQQQMP